MRNKKIMLAIGICLAVLSFLVTLAVAWSAAASEGNVYYGVVPSRIWSAWQLGEQAPYVNWRLRTESVASDALVSIAAPKDGTQVQVFILNSGSWTLKTAFEMNAMEKNFVSLENGTVFKVFSNQPVTVQLFGGNIDFKRLEPGYLKGPIQATFYPSVDGGYVGKEFLFVATDWTNFAPTPYKILALEKSDITITKDDGSKQNFGLEANSYRKMSFTNFAVYKVESTGNIMIWSSGLGTWIGTWEDDARGGLAVPSAQGGLVGTRFYFDSTTTWLATLDCGLRLYALENAKVTVWNLQYKTKMEDLTINGGGAVTVKPKAEAIMMESDKPIMVSYVYNGDQQIEIGMQAYTGTVTYLGVKSNEEAILYLPTNCTVEAYFFATESARVLVDDIPIPIKGDSYFSLNVPGQHRILSDKDVIIQVVYWPIYPPFQGVISFGTTVPSVESVSVRPTVELTPLAGESFPTTYILIGAVAVVAVAVGAFVALRHKKT